MNRPSQVVHTAGDHARQRRIAIVSAATVGVGLGIWAATRTKAPVKDTETAIGGTSTPEVDAWARFWARTFELQGGVRQPAAEWRGKPLVINFWATWCPPCVEELPMLDDFYRENVGKGWKMIAIAADSESKVATFLKQQPLQIPVAVLGADAIAMSKAFGNIGGGLPFTIVLDSRGDVSQRKSGQVKGVDLQNWRTIT